MNFGSATLLEIIQINISWIGECSELRVGGLMAMANWSQLNKDLLSLLPTMSNSTWTWTVWCFISSQGSHAQLQCLIKLIFFSPYLYLRFGSISCNTTFSGVACLRYMTKHIVTNTKRHIQKNETFFFSCRLAGEFKFETQYIVPKFLWYICVLIHVFYIKI